MLSEDRKNPIVDIESSPATSQIQEESEEEEEFQMILLKDVDDKVAFLSSVGFIFLIYFCTCALVNIFLLLDMRMAKSWYRSLRLDITTPILIGISLVIKLSFSVGSFMRSFQFPCFVIDFVLTFWFVLGIYFWLDERLR